MGANDHIGRWDAFSHMVTCDCGAVYKIYEDDGVPGCRDIETVECQFCGKELARHFGTCDGYLVDDSKVKNK